MTSPRNWIASMLVCGFVTCTLKSSAYGYESVVGMTKERILTQVDKLRPLFPSMTLNPTNWSRAFPQENDDNFYGFLESIKDVPPTLDRIYIVPLKRFDGAKAETIQLVAEFLQIFYGIQTEIIAPLDSSTLNRNSKGQINAFEVTDRWLPENLNSEYGERALSIITITDDDLYYDDGKEKMNFLFGNSSGDYRFQIWSFGRFGDPNSDEGKKRFVERSLKISTHETGHQMALLHIKEARCIMNGYNTLNDLDTSPLELCPTDLSKIWFWRKINPVERIKRLVEFAQKHQILVPEVKLWNAEQSILSSEH